MYRHIFLSMYIFPASVSLSSTSPRVASHTIGCASRQSMSPASFSKSCGMRVKRLMVIFFAFAKTKTSPSRPGVITCLLSLEQSAVGKVALVTFG